ncbi:MAG: hypothetical protein OXG39_09285 [Chloroflexi bacterium]|nr:hypothetical protein [Chloroflexota bacterium]
MFSFPARYLLAFFSVAVLLIFAAPLAFAETISLEFGCTLNNAIRSALTDASVGGCRAGDPGRDIIYVVDTVRIVDSPVEITQDMSFVGDRYTSTLDGQGRYSFFRVAPGVTVNLQDFFMSNGYGTRETGQIRVGAGGRLHLNVAKIINCHGVEEIVAPSDALVSIGAYSSVCGKSEPFNPHLPVIPPPDPNDSDPGSTQDSSIRIPERSKPWGSSPKHEKIAAATPAPRARVYTCEHLPADIVVRAFAGTRSGIQCQQIDARGVGIQSVINAGLILAVDIWGYVDPGVEVCLRGSGSLIFLDATTAPRRPNWMTAYGEPGWTCSVFYRPGSLVLVRSGPESTTI